MFRAGLLLIIRRC